MRLRLKLTRVFVDLTDSGRLSQIVGPATEKARSPNLVRVRGTMKCRLLTERKRCRSGSLLADAMDSLRCTGEVIVVNRESQNRESQEFHLVLDPVSDWQPVELLQW